MKIHGALDGIAVMKAPAAPKAAAKAAAAPRPAPPGFFGYGIQIDPGGDRGAAIGAIKGLGFNWVKFQLPWKHFEGGGPGARNWPDDVVGDLNGNGLNILASIVKAPDWARAGQHRPGSRRAAGRSGRLRQLCRRVRGALLRPRAGHRSLERTKPVVRMGRRDAWMPRATSGSWPPPIGPSRPRVRA